MLPLSSSFSSQMKGIIPVIMTIHFPTLLSKFGSFSETERKKNHNCYSSIFWKKESRKKKSEAISFQLLVKYTKQNIFLVWVRWFLPLSCSVWFLLWNILNQVCFSHVHLSSLWAQGPNLQNSHTRVQKELVNGSQLWQHIGITGCLWTLLMWSSQTF